ncbi:restriction endonuclease subunit S [Neobacillus sp. YIM B06451]|uniref:restriction endonuclease subunit S n=1 Tax=Neobacillus sp. YIM B06451 TaxID=3070994 RepID=UPI0029319125|nr:restriction endonuclease subunit S [Neobacillus sp. YIM B06451]
MTMVANKVTKGYRMTELGEIPMEWEIQTLDDISIKILDGVHSTPSYTKEGIKFLSVENITNENFTATKYISLEDHLEYSKRCNVEKNDILMTRIGTLGIPRLVDWDFESSIYVSLALIKLKNKRQAKFLAQYMRSDIFLKEVMKRSLLNATPQKINLGDIGKIPVILPSFNEQQQIAEILSALDQQIEITNQLIEKIKELKKGLMQQLLTKGIGHSEFKQTELGEIPVVWELKTLGQSCHVIMGQSPKGDSYNTNGTGIPLLNGPTEFGDRHPKVIQWTTSPTKFCEANDILFCVRGSSIGRMNIANQRYCIGRGLAAIRQGKDTITKYIGYILEHKIEQVLKNTSGSTFPNITKDELNGVSLPIPSIEEQNKIVDILSTVDEQIKSYEQEKEKYTKLKKGLMQQLFTGKLRVTV